MLLLVSAKVQNCYRTTFQMKLYTPYLSLLFILFLGIFISIRYFDEVRSSLRSLVVKLVSSEMADFEYRLREKILADLEHQKVDTKEDMV